MIRKNKKVVEDIVRLYNDNIPIRELSRKFCVARNTIKNILKENNLNIKDSRSALISRGYIKEKKKFRLPLREKAYLFGLVGGDLTPVKKSNYTLKLITHTTHPAFSNLLRESFRKYGTFSANKNKNNDFRCCTYLDLESFSFLLDPKKDNIPKWINKSSLLYYLGGFIDSDGCITIKKTDKYFQFVIKFCSQNLILLRNLKRLLERRGYRISIHRNHKKGDFSYHNGKKIVYNKDYYVIEITNKPQVLELLRILPIRHSEKIAKKELIFKIKKSGLVYWEDIKEDVLRLRQQIKEEVRNR